MPGINDLGGDPRIHQQQISPDTQIEKAAEKAPAEKAESPQLQARQEITEAILDKKYASATSMADSTIGPLIQKDSRLQSKVDNFRDTHKEKCRLIQNKGWKELTKTMGVKVNSPSDSDNLSVSDFRTECNKLVDEVTAEVGKKLGLQEVTWTAAGTVSPFSDVDTALRTTDGSRISTKDAVLYKNIRNLVHTQIFRGLSGTQLDTESYIPHIAATSYTNLLNSPSAKEKLATFETGMAILQARISFQDAPVAYEITKTEELETIDNPERQNAMRALYDQVETWVDNMQNDVFRQVLREESGAETIDAKLSDKFDQISNEKAREKAAPILKKDPEAFKRADVTFKSRLIGKLAERASSLETKIEAFQKKQQSIPLSPQFQKERKLLQEETEKLALEHLTLSGMINSLQDEGTMSASEGKVTLFNAGGQIEAGKRKKATKEFSRRRASSPAIRRRAANQIIQTDREHLRRSLTPKEFKMPTNQELLLASFEERQQFNHILHEGLEKAESRGEEKDAFAGQAAIASGKYALRAAGNMRRALENIRSTYRKKGGKLPKKFHNLEDTVRQLSNEAFQLERCKRKFSLNSVSTTRMLEEKISPKLTMDKNKLQSELKALLKKYDFGGERYNSVMKKSEIVTDLSSQLEKLGYITTKTLEKGEERRKVPEDPEIHKILRARAGSDRLKDKNAHLNALHIQSDEITLKELNLETFEDVELFGKQLNEINHDVMQMAFDAGILPELSEGYARALDFNGHYAQAVNPEIN